MGMFTAGRSAVLYIVGAVLAIAGVICLSRFGVETPGPNSTGQFVTWNAGFTIGAAFLIGIGVLMIAMGFVRGRRGRGRSHRGPSRDLEPGASEEVRH